MSSFRLSSEPSELDLDRVHGWLTRAYWSEGIRRDVVERAFARSLWVGAFGAEGLQVGVARVVTDQATFAWLCDVFVDESARGQGIAKAMVKQLLADPRLQTLRRWSLATRDAHEVYRGLGFTEVPAATWMELRPDPRGWKAT